LLEEKIASQSRMLEETLTSLETTKTQKSEIAGDLQAQLKNEQNKLENALEELSSLRSQEQQFKSLEAQYKKDSENEIMVIPKFFLQKKNLRSNLTI
jgi:hypothetical protein